MKKPIFPWKFNTVERVSIAILFAAMLVVPPYKLWQALQETAEARAAVLQRSTAAQALVPAALQAIDQINTSNGLVVLWSGPTMEPLIVQYAPPEFAQARFTTKDDKPALYNVYGVTKSGLLFRVSYRLDAEGGLQITAGPRTMEQAEASEAFVAAKRMDLVARFKLPVKTS